MYNSVYGMGYRVYGIWYEVHGMSQGFCYGLVSGIMASWRNDVSAYTVVANNVHYSFHRL